jgi:predicted dehydrogenase
MTQEKIKVAVIGGGIGRQHLEGFAKLKDKFEVTVFCDLDQDRCDTLASEFGIPHTTTSFDEVCMRDDVDVVDICTPPYLHFDQISQVLNSGKDAICEKPLVGTPEDVEKLMELCRKTGQHVLPIYQYRYGSGVEKLMYLKDQGILGTPYVANIEVAWYRNKNYFSVPWRRKRSLYLGGCLMDQSIHMHDIACQVMGDVKSVTARTRMRVHDDIETEDCASVILEMQNGSLVTESITLGAHGEKTRLKFCFENMTVTSDHDNPYRPQEDPWVFTSATPEVEEKMNAALESFTPSLGSYAGLFSDYYDACINKTDLPVTLNDAYYSIKLVNDMYLSDQTGSSVEFLANPKLQTQVA